ncbi:acetylornithine deacetylase/succinyl-diaminopimelate desuccinylase-like protein [Actinoplanes tereljensis]|uniref:Dipeptidase n=1 Tax=Paractinoplanes tereljensis TaxID=571912 RepID=A0A919TT37_9ACTN|nr:dipeptidase [Actinoplanes tereljensis]GIF19985.1 dipeptidase [Actinoplanes tereljensis]
MSEELRSRIKALMPQARDDLAAMVAYRSVHDAAQFPPAECEGMVDWLVGTFGDLGFADVAAYPTPDGSQAVCGSRPGPPGAPTVLLYFHHDVQPPLDPAAWRTPVWELTDRDGRWYGRGAADCKGNIATHLTALRALSGELPVTVKIVGEGSEEQGTGGLEAFVPANAELLRADAILVCDAGNAAVGQPAVTSSLRGLANVVVSVDSMAGPMHSGMFGGAAPDALAALIHMLATLRDAHGNTTIRGLDATQRWPGADYSPAQFRVDAGLLDGVGLLGDGRVADMVWARPAVTVLGIDCPPVVGSSAAIQPHARARINLRVPPGMNAKHAQDALIDQLRAAAPWGVRVSVEREADGEPFTGATSGPAFETMTAAMREAYGRPAVTEGQGGSIPLCNVFRDTFPDAEIMLIGVEEPRCLIHAPNESVDPSEIENMALVEALFLRNYAAERR